MEKRLILGALAVIFQCFCSKSASSSPLLHVFKCYLISAAVTESHDFVIWSFRWRNRCKPLQNRASVSDSQQRVGVGWNHSSSPPWLCWTSLYQTVSLRLIFITLPSQRRRRCEVVGRMFLHSSETLKKKQERSGAEMWRRQKQISAHRRTWELMFNLWYKLYF